MRKSVEILIVSRGCIKAFQILLLLLIIFTTDGRAQIDDFGNILSSCIRNKTFFKRTSDIESERTFLGFIRDDDKKVLYYVIKEFYTVQAAVVRHGHSRILFFGKNKRLASVYIVEGWDLLPYKLSGNCLFFRYKKDDKAMVQIVKVGKILPVPLCVKPNDCYWPQKE